MLDGGPGAEPSARLDAWLVTDARSELIVDVIGRLGMGCCCPTWGGLRTPRSARARRRYEAGGASRAFAIFHACSPRP